MYEFTSRIRYSECGADSRLRLPELVNYFQDCAIFHAEDTGRGHAVWKQEGYAWLILTWQILLTGELPRCGDKVRVRTSPYAFRGFEGDRNFQMFAEDGTELARADARMLTFNIKAQRPVRVPEGDIEAFPIDPELAIDKMPAHVTVPEDAEELPGILIGPDAIDVQRHVNNEKYIDFAMRCIQEDRRVAEIRVQYIRQVRLNDTIVPFVRKDGEGAVCAFMLDGKPCAVIQLIFA